jgi:hypothetical protein
MKKALVYDNGMIIFVEGDVKIKFSALKRNEVVPNMTDVILLPDIPNEEFKKMQRKPKDYKIKINGKDKTIVPKTILDNPIS